MTALRVSFVDDNPAERDLAREAFTEYAPDVELTTIGSRAELISHLDKNISPDLVLLDLHLGRDLGDDIVLQLQGHAAHLVSLIILTNTNDDLDRKRCLDAGAVDFWIKPMHFSGYKDLINRAKDVARRNRQSI